MGLYPNIIGGTGILLVLILRRSWYYNFPLPSFIVHRPSPRASTSKKYNPGTRLLWQWRYCQMLWNGCQTESGRTVWDSSFVWVWCSAIGRRNNLRRDCYGSFLSLRSCKLLYWLLVSSPSFLVIRAFSPSFEYIQLLIADGALFRSTLFCGSVPVIVESQQQIRLLGRIPGLGRSSW